MRIKLSSNIIYAFLILIVSVLVSAWAIERNQVSVKQSIHNEVISNMRGAAENIAHTFDPEDHKKIVNERLHQNHPLSVKYYEWFTKIVQIHRVNYEYVYTVAKVDGKYYFVFASDPQILDTDIYGNPVYGDFPVIEEYADYPKELEIAFDTGEEVVTGKYKDEWGEHISVFHPLKDSEGNLYAILGVDIEAKTYDKKFANLESMKKKNIYGAFGFCLFIAFIAFMSPTIIEFIDAIKLHLEIRKYNKI